MNYSVRLPLSFWKVCVLRRQDNSLAATAFVLGQPDAADLPDVQQEKFDVGATQVTIAHLEKITGLDFGLLQDNDHFATSGESGSLEVMQNGEKRLVRPLASFDDVVI
jgi:DNA/RNA endonuclease G (NUC1)